MRVIARGTLYGFINRRVPAAQRRAVKSQLDSWYVDVTGACWKNSAELKAQFRSASVLTAERVVFNIKGNDYRLIVAIDYAHQFVLIKWLGTHKEYDAIDAAKSPMKKPAMTIRPIKTNQDHRAAIARIETLMGATLGSAESDELEVLVTLVDAYETKHYPMDAPDPVDAIVFRMEQQQLNRKDLEPMIGSRARVSEVLTRKRPLTLQMVRRVRQGLGISADVLIAAEPRHRRASR